MQGFVILAALEVLGLGIIWLLLSSRLRRGLELDSFVESVRREVRGLETELNEATERNVSLIEDRLESLRGLLEEADRRILAHRRELGNRELEVAVYDRLGRSRPQVPPNPVQPPEERREARGAPVPEPIGQAEAAALLGAKDEESANEPIRLDLARRLPEASRARESVIPPRPLRERVLELHDRGFSPELIAARLGATVAEVELLVSMEEGRRAGS